MTALQKTLANRVYEGLVLVMGVGVFATPLIAVASVSDGCNYYGYDCHTNSVNSFDSNYYNTNSGNYGYRDNYYYGNTNNYSYTRQVDPNVAANSYAASHQTANNTRANGCNYYGYDCYNSTTATNNSASYVRQSDPNDIANRYIDRRGTYYSPSYYYNYYPSSYRY